MEGARSNRRSTVIGSGLSWAIKDHKLQIEKSDLFRLHETSMTIRSRPTDAKTAALRALQVFFKCDVVTEHHIALRALEVIELMDGCSVCFKLRRTFKGHHANIANLTSYHRWGINLVQGAWTWQNGSKSRR